MLRPQCPAGAPALATRHSKVACNVVRCIDTSLLLLGACCKALLYFLVGLYANINISLADFQRLELRMATLKLRFIASSLSQRFAAQVFLALCLVI